MKKKNYYLGLDMGTSSAGWAVTDENYNLLRAKGKDLWGVREFEEAKTAEERRAHRISRRRRQREVIRIGLLKSYFADAIEAIDPDFLQRLDNSKYRLADKDIKVRNKNGIFNDPNYTDKDYFSEYPTIFHLRSELINNTEAHDVRLVYLALLNMFKHRGHFLNSSISLDGDQRKLSDCYQDFCREVSEVEGISFDNEIDSEEVEAILTNREYSRSRKAEELAVLLGVGKKEKQKNEYIKAICGLKTEAKRLFSDIQIGENEKVEICFSDFGYEDKEPDIAEILGDEFFAIVELLKQIYEAGVLANVLKGGNYLSEARVTEYEKHRRDLNILKSVIKKYKSKEEYDWLFRSEEAGSYSAYVNSVNTGAKGRRNMKGRKAEDLYKSVSKLMKGLPLDDADVTYVLTEIKNENFLPKQLTASNGVIPNQVHAKEMKRILENAEEYLPFLKEIDESGYTVSERILKLFTFQMPYYIGPTSTDSKTGWIIRKEKGQVLPWNLEQKIDIKETSEKFISKMVRNCSYVNGERVLPKASLEYESFCVLNEINNIEIEGDRISPELKQDIYNQLFKKGKKVTRRQLVNFLYGKGVLQDESQLSGIDITINNSLATYGKFKAILGDEMEKDTVKHMVEQIVNWATIYGDSKKLLKEKIEEAYGEVLTEAQIKRILGFKFKDWGNLSKEFLELQGCNKETGEILSLIRVMWETNCNLMELLHSPQFTYKEALEEKQKHAIKSLVEMQPEDLDEFYFSAPVKRMIWQTLLIIKEIESIMGTAPKRVFIEMTRKPDEVKKRTITRKQKFLDLYKNIKGEIRDWKDEIEKAENNGTLKSKKMYLYLTQMGRCMYTGEEIDLDDLFNDNLYDIDHVYPRHFVKDDNIDNNLVLVKKETNAHKSDTYPLEESIYKMQQSRWKLLKEKGLISEEKYRRLTGRKAFTEEQKADFIARQLVETSQGTKSVAEILKAVLPDTQVVYSKASNVSEFRQARKLVKSRSVNDFHHAHDAYLNIVVGNVYFVKFTQNPLNFIKKEYAYDEEKYRYNLSRMFDWTVKRGGEVAWIGPKKDGAEGTITTVKKMLAKNTPLLTRRIFEAHGGIANETLVGAKKASPDNYIPLKSKDAKMTDVTKYGGFTNVFGAYFFLVEYTEKGKRVRALEQVPIYMKERIEQNETNLIKYCTDELKLQDPSIRMAKIRMQSLIKKDGFFVYITGRTGNQIVLRNAVNLCLKEEWIKYIKGVEKYNRFETVSEQITKENNMKLYEQLLDKHVNGIYAKRPNPIGPKLQMKQKAFEALSLEQQCKVLSEILKVSAIGGAGADLSLINEGKTCGTMKVTKKFEKVTEIILINQSVTGVFESQIDLLTI